MPSKIRKPTSFHWGSYYAETENEKLVGMRPYENDKDPSSIACLLYTSPSPRDNKASRMPSSA